MKKNRGSILIETIVALSILLIGFTVTLSLFSDLLKSQNIRNENRKMETSIRAICSEVKYNIKYKELKEKLEDGKVVINYSDDFINLVIKQDLFSLGCNNLEDNKIEIVKISESEDLIKINIKIIYNKGRIEQEIIKAPWMDEI